LLDRLQACGREVFLTREPGGTATGETIRSILQHDRCGEPLCDETELFLFLAARAQLVSQVIKPELERGGVVLCDRFADSTTVYQGYARGFGFERVEVMNKVATLGLEPDITFLLDLTVEESFNRLAERNRKNNSCRDRIENEPREFHEQVRDGYLALAHRSPGRITVIDATSDPETIGEQIWAILKTLFFESL
ncbi:MAG: dTMP kinase, partial [Lentisphaerae bacterium]|nr:dTMP kinase [Lentisphaerota bacterium]